MNKKTVGILSVFTAINLGSLLLAAFATTPLTGTSGTITVGSAPPVIITSATIGATNCPVSTNTTFTCPNNSIPGPGQVEVLQVNLKNTAVVSETIPAWTPTFTSTGTTSSSILSISGNCPASLSPGSTGSCSFTIQGLTTGSDSFTLTI